MPQASAKGVGCDCKGLLVGVARELGMPEATSLYAAMADYDLGAVPSDLLREGIAATLKPVEPARVKPGDVLLLRIAGKPAHLAIVTDGNLGGGRAVHAQISSTAWVKETAMRVLLAVYELDSAWRFARWR